MIRTRGPSEGTRTKDRRDTGELIAIRIHTGKMFSCKYPDDVGEIDKHSGFFPCLTHCRISRQLIRIEDSTRCSPQPRVLVLHEQQPPLVVVGQHRNRRNLQQIRTDLGTEGFDKVGNGRSSRWMTSGLLMASYSSACWPPT